MVVLRKIVSLLLPLAVVFVIASTQIFYLLSAIHQPDTAALDESLYSRSTWNFAASSFDGNPYLEAIMNLTDQTLDRLSCPPIGVPPNRYNHLKVTRHEKSFWGGRRSPAIKYFFAINLFQCKDVLPTMLGAVVEAIRFLGPENCALSIVEGRSTDGTFEIVAGLREEIEKLGVHYYLVRNDTDPKSGKIDRIHALAGLRNQALRPLIRHSELYNINTLIIFVNDITLCADDLLEMLHQQIVQSAVMTCAMDWKDTNGVMAFYDLWIARGINGDIFYEVPQDVQWSVKPAYADNLFWNDRSTRAKLDKKEPFQVYSCWNGVVVFSAEPILKGILFRGATELECTMGEPTLFCKDLWRNGYGKIQVVPTVNVAYEVDQGERAKTLYGRVGDYVDQTSMEDDTVPVHWQLQPPGMIKCVSQKWRDWSWGPSV
jgi:alpha-1,3-mannosyltransferase